MLLCWRYNTRNNDKIATLAVSSIYMYAVFSVLNVVMLNAFLLYNFAECTQNTYTQHGGILYIESQHNDNQRSDNHQNDNEQNDFTSVSIG
jgi:hypothetical protein